MDYKITDKVTWVGKIDWDLRRFHGDEYSTYKGTSYNSYLIRDEKNVLIDTAWLPFDKEFVNNLKKHIDLKDIDYIVMNHSEVDHSGALVELMREIPETPIYCTQNGISVIKGHYHKDWNFVPVKTGDTLDIGDSKLVFIEARMLHWPDTMFTYMTKDNILFSNDGFAQHYASENLYSDMVDQDELFYEAMKYYANILTPFNPLVKNKIKEILDYNYPIDIICPSHGVIWRDNPTQIVEKYMEWADNYKENQITIIYDTMWNGTRRMAEIIAKGIKSVDDDVTVKLLNTAKTDKNDVMVEIFKSKAIIVGSSTINRGLLFSLAGNLEMMKGLGFKGKKASAIGSYGWSGEAVKLISDHLVDAGFELVDEGLKIMWQPDKEAEKKCFEYGREYAKKVM